MTTAKKRTVKKLDQGRKGEISAFFKRRLNVNSDSEEVTSLKLLCKKRETNGLCSTHSTRRTVTVAFY